MRRTALLLALLATALPGGAASAQSVSLSAGISLDLDFPAVPATPTVLTGFLALGSALAFLDAGGTVVATVRPDGVLVPTPAYSAGSAVRVRITTADAGGAPVRETFALAAPLAASSQIRVETVVLRTGRGKASLVSAMQRQHDKIKGKKPRGAGHPGKGHGNR